MKTFYIIKPIFDGEQQLNDIPIFTEEQGKLVFVYLSLQQEEPTYTWAKETINLWLKDDCLLEVEDKPTIITKNKIGANLGDIMAEEEHGTWIVVFNSEKLGVIASGFYYTKLRAKKQCYLFPTYASWIIQAPEPVLSLILNNIEWEDFYPNIQIEDFINQFDISFIKRFI